MANPSVQCSLNILILGFIFSGNQFTNYSNIVQTIPNRIMDTVIKDIPLRDGKPEIYYRNKPIVENLLGLSSLETGFDSLQIRLWYSYGRNDSAQLIIIKNTNRKWYGELYSLVYRSTEDGSRLASIPNSRRSIEPISGWKYFIDKLLQLQIYSLPDEGKIKNYPDWTEPSTIIVEMATLKKYRIYMYNEPASAQKKIWQAKNMEMILELIDHEFSIKRVHKF